MRENLMRQMPPHVRQSESLMTMMTDVIIALLPLYLMSFFYYGARAVVLGIFGVAGCAVCSALSNLIIGEKINFRDLTPVITGLIIPLLLPADIPFYVVFAAVAVAILVVKMPFGGTGNNLFNPAAVGYAAAAICRPELVFKYPAVLQKISLLGEGAVSAQSPAASLAMRAVPEYDILDLLVGCVPGQMGATHIFVIAACGIFLIVRKAVNWRPPVFFLATCALMSLALPRINGSAFEIVCYDLFSGMVFFGAFFMLPEPVTSPKRDFAKALYSVVAGITAVLFRYFGGLEGGFVYALIVINVFAPLFDKLCESALHVLRHSDKLLSAYEARVERFKPSAKEKVVFSAIKYVSKKDKKAKAAAAEVPVEEISAPTASEAEPVTEATAEVGLDEVFESSLEAAEVVLEEPAEAPETAGLEAEGTSKPAGEEPAEEISFEETEENGEDAPTIKEKEEAL